MSHYLPDIFMFVGLACLLAFCLIVYPLAALALVGVVCIAFATVLYRAERHTQ